MWWAVQLLPILSGQVQIMAQQLPDDKMLEYMDLNCAFLKQANHTLEQHYQQFCSPTLGEVSHTFTFAQQLQDICWQWLLAEEHDSKGVINMVVLEQFIIQLPEGTVKWV